MEEEAIIGDVGNRGKFEAQARKEVTAHCLSGFLETHFTGACNYITIYFILSYLI